MPISELPPPPLEQPIFSRTTDLVEIDPPEKFYITAIGRCIQSYFHNDREWCFQESDSGGTYIHDNGHLTDLLIRMYERMVHLHGKTRCPYLIYFDADVLDEGGNPVLSYSNNSAL